MIDQTTYYVVGDTHGMYKMYKAMIKGIMADIDASILDDDINHSINKKFHIILLGDYVDRGPDSYKLVSKIMELQQDIKAANFGLGYSGNDAKIELTVLRGNHEDMMVNAYFGGREDQRHWIRNGGDATLDSCPDEKLPLEVLKWARELPYKYIDEERKLFFVHAGIIPRSFPFPTPEEMIWTRSPSFFADDHWADLYPDLDGWLIIHGHTPDFDSMKPYYSPRRINLDAAAVYGGPLCGVKIGPNREITKLKVTQDLAFKKKEQKIDSDKSEVQVS